MRRLISSSISSVVHVVRGVEQWLDVAFPLPPGCWAAGSTRPVVEWWDRVNLPKEDEDDWLPVCIISGEVLGGGEGALRYAVLTFSVDLSATGR